MSNPLASVIIPVYNAGAYLEECVDSIRGQTYSHLEIILVDDGSTDGGGRICDGFSEEDPRIRVIHQENKGVSAARNAGLDAAKGTYIYFVDSDDWVAETMVEESVLVMEQKSYDICSWGHMVYEVGNSLYCGRWETNLFQFPTEEKKRNFLCRYFLAYRLGWGVTFHAFRRDIIERGRLRFLPEIKIYEDMDFCFRYLLGCQNLYYIPKPFYVYRQHNASATHTSKLQKWAAYMLHVVRQQERVLSGRTVVQPFYIYSGVILTGFVDSYNFMKDQSAEYRLRQTVECFASTEDWLWLVEKAQEAGANRSAIRRVCGLRQGGRISAFYQYILCGDSTPFCRWDQVQKGYERLRDIKVWLLRRWTVR